MEQLLAAIIAKMLKADCNAQSAEDPRRICGSAIHAEARKALHECQMRRAA